MHIRRRALWHSRRMDAADFDIPAADARPVDPIDIAAVVAEAKRILHLGEFDPIACGRGLGLDDVGIRFCLGLLKGQQQTEALRATGYRASTESGLRKRASTLARQPRVKKFIELAREHKTAAPAVAIPDDDEQLRILAAAVHTATNVNFKISGVRAIQ